MHHARNLWTLPIPGLLLAILLGTGCATSRPELPPAEPPLVMPDPTVQGRVVTVNLPLRYVVMDFPARAFPALDQRLNIYREGQKVGEVRVTGPILGTATAGDIVIGQAAVGDEVRED